MARTLKGTVAIPATTLLNGTTALPDATLPVGTTDALLVIDGSQAPANLSILVTAQIVDAGGQVVATFTNQVEASAAGEFGRDRQGNPITQIDMDFGWGVPSQAGWKAKASYTVVNGPLVTSGGTLTLSA